MTTWHCNGYHNWQGESKMTPKRHKSRGLKQRRSLNLINLRLYQLLRANIRKIDLPFLSSKWYRPCHNCNFNRSRVYLPPAMRARHSAQLILYFTTLAFGGSLSYLLNIACIDLALTNHDMKRNDRIVVSQVIEVITDYDPKSCSGTCLFMSCKCEV